MTARRDWRPLELQLIEFHPVRAGGKPVRPYARGPRIRRDGLHQNVDDTIALLAKQSFPTLEAATRWVIDNRHLFLDPSQPISGFPPGPQHEHPLFAFPAKLVAGAPTHEVKSDVLPIARAWDHHYGLG